MRSSSSRTIGSVLLLAMTASGLGCGAGYRYNRYARRYGGEVPFMLVNDTPLEACYVRLSPSTDRNWGDDWLGPSETIPAGVARTFAVAGGPAWDIQIQTCGHQVMAEARQVPIMGPTQLAISQLRPQMMQAPAPVYVQPMQKDAPGSSGN